MLSITSKAFLDAGSIFILLTLSVSHIFVFAGRLDAKEERTNLYFSFISCLLAFYVFINSVWGSRFYILTSSRLQPILEGLVFLSVFVCFIMYLSGLTSYRLPRPFAVALLSTAAVLTLLTALPFFRPNGLNLSVLYFSYLFFPVTIGISLTFAAAVLPFLVHIVRKKLYAERSILFMLLGLAAVLGRLISSKALIASHRMPADDNVILAAACMLFALALSQRFNGEYRALRELKRTLERKVEERTEELLEAKEKISAMSEQKTTLFMNLAHETRTPLTLIRYHLESWLAKHGHDDDVSIIRDNVRKLQRDMVNFLDSEKIRKGEILYDHTEPVDLPEFLKEKAALFRPLAERKGLEFRTEIRGEGSLLSDAFALDRVLNNLLLNAVKFTDSGYVSLELDRIAGRWKLTVRDTGRGMDETAMRAVSEPFAFLVDRKENIRGYGMGLFITRKILEELGGGIHVESGTGVGSVFTIDLPVCEGAADRREPGGATGLRMFFEDGFVETAGNRYRQVAGAANDPTGDSVREPMPTICVAEDNPELLKLLTEGLGGKYSILAARSGREALEKLSAGDTAPDLILSDIMMDDGDGEEFFEAVHADPRFDSVPFVFCSARCGEDSVVNALGRGAVEFVAKPFSMAELSARIDSLIAHSRRQRERTLEDVARRPPDDERSEERFAKRCVEHGLSGRQKEIIELIGEGFEYKEIADRLCISGRTVTRHVQNVYEKLGVHNKVELLNRLYGRNETAGGGF